MKNIKEIVYGILSNNENLIEIVKDIFDAYPNVIEEFPCVIFIESGQNDIEFADNKALATNVEITIHIYTKAVEGFPTTSEIGTIVDESMKEHSFVCGSNMEVPDINDDVRHRVMIFRNYFF